MLKKPILHLLWGLVDRFIGYNFPKPEPMWIKSGIQVTSLGAHSHKKKWGKSPRGFRFRMPKRVFFLLLMQRGLSVTYPAPISTFLKQQT